MNVHNHDIDPSCQETRAANGALRGECMARLLVPYTGPPITDGVEHYPGCGCPRCATIRADRWASLNLIDRLQESLNAKIEGDNGHLPIRGMMNLADVQALITQVRSQT